MGRAEDEPDAWACGLDGGRRLLLQAIGMAIASRPECLRERMRCRFCDQHTDSRHLAALLRLSDERRCNCACEEADEISSIHLDHFRVVQEQMHADKAFSESR